MSGLWIQVEFVLAHATVGYRNRSAPHWPGPTEVVELGFGVCRRPPRLDLGITPIRRFCRSRPVVIRRFPSYYEGNHDFKLVKRKELGEPQILLVVPICPSIAICEICSDMESRQVPLISQN